MWQPYFDKIFVINLAKREDRKDQVIELLTEYGISAFIYEAYEHTIGYLGLVQTMQELFKECLEKGYERILVFEDDVNFVVPTETFHTTMNKCVEDLKKLNWGLFYLGIQHCKAFTGFTTENLLPVRCL
jgi:GR25 family glycosyltransferase involved in LPS biosynthesis